MNKPSLVLALCSSLAFTACDTRPLPGGGLTGPAGPAGPEGPIGPPGPAGMSAVARVPSGVWLDAVNSVSFTLSEDGLSVTNRDTTGYGTPGGAFDDATCQTAGTRGGNKGLVGLAHFSGKELSRLGPIEVTARQDRGQPFLYLNLLVDCDGNGVFDATDAIVVADSVALPGLAVTREGQTVRADPARPIWRSVGGRCGLPDHNGTTAAPLSALPAAARLLNARPRDCGMPRGAELASILLVQGDSLDRQFRHSTVQELSVTYDGKQERYRFGLQAP